MREAARKALTTSRWRATSGSEAGAASDAAAATAQASWRAAAGVRSTMGAMLVEGDGRTGRGGRRRGARRATGCRGRRARARPTDVGEGSWPSCARRDDGLRATLWLCGGSSSVRHRDVAAGGPRLAGAGRGGIAGTPRCVSSGHARWLDRVNVALGERRARSRGLPRPPRERAELAVPDAFARRASAPRRSHAKRWPPVAASTSA